MFISRYLFIAVAVLIICTSCEEVIDVDLNFSDPALVVEAVLYNDSVSLVRLTRTTSYFAQENPGFVEDARIQISDGTSEEVLTYINDGYYIGDTIIGTEERDYEIEITHDGITYEGISYMPRKTEIIALRYGKDDSPNIYNPYGKMVYTITCQFYDNPDIDNFYMICYTENGEMIEKNYFLLTEYDAIGGSFTKENNTITFSESIFYEGGEVEVRLFSIDESVYNYFKQLNDVLFWKRRVIPPSPYNPVSNINNGVLGYFAAWAYDSEIIMLE